jgi:hypothetical protein
VRDLIVTENITLDGVIEATEGWFAPAGDDQVDRSDLIAALTAAMLYAPRSEHELDVVETLVRASHAFARLA